MSTTTQPYVKQTWVDHIVADDTGEVLQQGTLLDAAHFNHMEEGIAAMDTRISQIAVSTDGITVAGIESKIETAVANCVEKVDGKDLSSNDFTDAYKAKIDSMVNALGTATFAQFMQRITDLETWKAQVLAGTTIVQVDDTTTAE